VCNFTGCCGSILDRIKGDLSMSVVRKHMRPTLCSLVEQMLSGWLVATRHLSWNLAHARISNS
jgi:hypothetical protein